MADQIAPEALPASSTTSAVVKQAHDWLKLPKQFDRWLCAQIAIYGALRQCKFRHWKSAFTELSLTLIFTLMPLWIPLIAFPMFGNLKFHTDELLFDQIKNGELYITSAALLAPIYYFTFPNTNGGVSSRIRTFPSQQLLILIFIVTVIVASLAITASRVQAATGPKIPLLVIDVSISLFAFCCCIFLLTLAVKNSLPEMAENALDQASLEEQTNYPPPNYVHAKVTAAIDPDDLVDSIIKEHTVKEVSDDAA